MNGPQHYAEAERLLLGVSRAFEVATANTFDDFLASSEPLLAQARVHAELAKVAAIVDTSTSVRSEEIAVEWARVLE